MAYQCTSHPRVIKMFSNPTNPQNDLITAINIIENAVGIVTSRAIQPVEYQLQDKITSEPIMKLGSTQEIIVINNEILRRISGLTTNPKSYAGAFHNKSGRIFLVENVWCYSNLIHETLHSRSVFSKMLCTDGLKFVYEGLTELIVGVVLKRQVSACFNIWADTESCFLTPYLDYVKPWYYISKKVEKGGFNQIIELYFDMAETSPYSRLGKILNRLTDGNFDIFEDLSRGSLFQIFKERLSQTYPKDFAAFQSSIIDEINLNHMV